MKAEKINAAAFLCLGIVFIRIKAKMKIKIK